MWRRISKREYRHVCRLEEKVIKINFINGFIWTIFALIMAMIFTAASRNRIAIFIVESLIAAAIYGYYCRSVYCRKRAYLRSRLYVQEGVCVGKKEIHTRWRDVATIYLVTEHGQQLADVRIPFPVYKEIDYNTRLLLVSNQREYTPEECERMKAERTELDYIDWIDSESGAAEYYLQVYPVQSEQ